jgi:hypothetical protein
MSDDDPMHHFMDGMKKKLLKGQGKYFFWGKPKFFMKSAEKKVGRWGLAGGV